MLDIVILFFGLAMVVSIVIGVLVATIIVGGMLIWTIYEEISMMTKSELLENVFYGSVSITWLVIAIICYFYLDFSGLLSCILGFIATSIFVCIIKFDEIKKEYKSLKHS